jgi:hypothetical protein
MKLGSAVFRKFFAKFESVRFLRYVVKQRVFAGGKFPQNLFEVWK